MNRDCGLAAIATAAVLVAGCASLTSPASPAASIARPLPPETAPPWSGAPAIGPVLEWTRLAPLAPGWLADVTSWSGGFAAVGSGIWLSPDGATWTSVDVEHLFDGATAEITAITGWRDGLVAAGHVPRDSTGNGDWVVDAVFWRSVDGSAWEAMTDESLELGYADAHSLPYGIRDVVAADDRLLAVGVGQVGSVWQSTDGRGWELTAGLPLDRGAMVAAGGATGITRGGPGFVAVGEDGCCGVYRGLVWTSADGDDWRFEPGIEGQGLLDVVLGHSGLVALAEGPGVWTSPDGTGWSWAPDQPALADGRMRGIAAAERSYVAVGSVRCAGQALDSSCPMFWTSPDGASWDRSPSGEDVPGEPVAVALARGVAVAVGADDAAHDDGASATVWLGTPRAP